MGVRVESLHVNNSVPMVGAHITAGDEKDEIKMCMKNKKLWKIRDRHMEMIYMTLHKTEMI